MRLNQVRLCSIVAILASGFLWGQGGGGSVNGTVTDSTGAVVPGVAIELTNKATGVVMKTTSTAAGRYAFPVVPTGNYTAKATSTGFSTTVIDNVIVALNQSSVVDISLRVGVVQQVLEVSASTAQMQTDTAQQATTIDNATYQRLPLAMAADARSPIGFLHLLPGVRTPIVARDNSSQAWTTTISGGQNASTDVQVDGAAIQSTNISGDFRNIPLPVDAIEEFTLISNNFAAEYGRTSGGIVTFNTKSGTNQVHGSLYEFLRNDKFDARGFFQKTTPVNRQNEYGFTFGGPIVLPKIYNGRDRTFIFGYFDGFKNRNGAQQMLATLPTPAQRQGDFSNIRDVNGNVLPIYDPLTNAADGRGGVTRTQFPGNTIPANRITTIAQNVIKDIPAVTYNTQTRNYLASNSGQNDTDKGGIKVDHNFNERNRLSVLFALSDALYSDNRGSPFTGPLSSTYIGVQRQKVGRINHTYIFSPTLINHLTAGCNRNYIPYYTGGRGSGFAARWGIAGIPQDNTPALTFSGYTGLGGADPGQIVAETSWTMADFASWTHGRHTLKAGLDFRKNGDNTLPLSIGRFTFTQAATWLPNSSTRTLTGDGFASFLTGAVYSASLQQTFSETGNRFKYLGTYVQDDFKASSKLTLNFGLRYEIPWTRVEVADRMSSFRPDVANPAAGGRLGAMVFAGTGPGRIGRRSFSDTYYKLFQPRFGFAYQLNSKTVLRGGYGVFASASGDVLENGQRQSYGNGFNVAVTSASTDQGITPAFWMPGGFPQDYPRPPFIKPELGVGGGVAYLSPEDGRTGTLQNWSFGVQRALPAKIVAEASYAASVGHHLGAHLININQVDPKYLSLGALLTANINSDQARAAGIPIPYAGFSASVAQALRPFPQYNMIERYNQASGNSTYHSLQVKVQRRFSRGFSLLAGYTLSKWLTDSESQLGGWIGATSMDNYNRRLEKSLGNTDVPHNLTLGYIYEFPFGKGKPFLNKPGLSDKLLGGWGLSGTHRYQSGLPLTVSGGGSLPLFNSTFRPLRVAGVDPLTSAGHDRGSFDPAKDRYLNLNAWAIPALYTFGNSPRTLPDVRGFPFFNEDISIFKRILVTERVSAEFRFDAFNILNRVTFSDPSGGYTTSGTFGAVSGQANLPRVCQAGLNVRF
jgi:hypothetical protein